MDFAEESHESFQSRYRAASHFRSVPGVPLAGGGYCFNLVIERLLISGVRGLQTARRGPGSFNLVIERLLISGHARLSVDNARMLSFNLVIERLLISGDSQVDTWLEHDYSFNLVIERLLISGIGNHYITLARISFNLVIERLLISGPYLLLQNDDMLAVSISLSSGFSFQVLYASF